MPNHITTQVEISGTKDQIDDLVKKTKLIRDNGADENRFDFNGIISMPEELKGTTSPTTIVYTDKEAQEKNNIDADLAAKNGWTDHTDKYLSEAEAKRREEKYGAINWYDFARNQWGTKWNAYEVRYIDGDDTKIILEFQTAWDTPRGIWKELERQGFTIRGVLYGEMDGYEVLGDGEEVFEIYQNVEVEYVG